MITVIGKLISISPSAALHPGGTIDFALCGYGSQFPRGTGAGAATGSICAPEVLSIPVLPSDNSFSVSLIGNDIIQPPGTYYTVTVRNDNGDIVQCNAYVFLESHGDYDLDFETPFDPSQSPQPIFPLMFPMLIPVAAAATTVLPGNKGSAFYVLVNTAITQLLIQNGVPGILYTVILQEDGTGNHPVTPDASLINFGGIKMQANGTTVQTLVCQSAAKFNAVAPAMWS